MSKIDDENKKLKKKMKEKKNGDKKKKKKGQIDYEEEEEEEDAPVVKVLANEMPEGALDDSGDEKSKRSLNDPHRALDINLDE